MSEILEAIKKAEQFCYDNMRTDSVLTSYPPKHVFKSGVSVEDIIQKIDNIKSALLYAQDRSSYSEAANELRKYAFKNFSSSQTKRDLYEIAAHMDNELDLVRENKPSMTKAICLPLITFLESYRNNGGQLSDDIMEHILNYCSQIETQYQKVLEHEREIFKNYLQLKEDVERFVKLP